MRTVAGIALLVVGLAIFAWIGAEMSIVPSLPQPSPTSSDEPPGCPSPPSTVLVPHSQCITKEVSGFDTVLVEGLPGEHIYLWYAAVIGAKGADYNTDFFYGTGRSCDGKKTSLFTTIKPGQVGFGAFGGGLSPVPFIVPAGQNLCIVGPDKPMKAVVVVGKPNPRTCGLYSNIAMRPDGSCAVPTPVAYTSDEPRAIATALRDKAFYERQARSLVKDAPPVIVKPTAPPPLQIDDSNGTECIYVDGATDPRRRAAILRNFPHATWCQEHWEPIPNAVVSGSIKVAP